MAIADWAVCLHAAHQGYIDWKEFMADQGRLADNVFRSLLQGIAICGRCGRRMSMRHTSPNADYPVYCDQQGSVLRQEVRALAVDALDTKDACTIWRAPDDLVWRWPKQRSNRHGQSVPVQVTHHTASALQFPEFGKHEMKTGLHRHVGIEMVAAAAARPTTPPSGVPLGVGASEADATPPRS
ncbi:hypothetical protein ACVWYH_005312 [Bradyrhizobium sp. GM24.11]